MGDGLKKVGDALSDPVGDEVQGLVNQLGHLAEEELWRRHGGPAPWDEADATPEPMKPLHGALSRAVTDEEAGIVDLPLTEEDGAAQTACAEAMRKAAWEDSGSEDGLAKSLKAGAERLFSKRKPA